MGLLDTISNFGTVLEDAFTPANERLRNQFLRERILEEKRFREQEARRKGLLEQLFQAPQEAQAPVNLGLDAPAPTINRTQGGLLADLLPGLTPVQQRALLEIAPEQIVMGLFPKEGKQTLAQKVADIEAITKVKLTPEQVNNLAGIDAMGKFDDLKERLEVELGLQDLEEGSGRIADRKAEAAKNERAIKENAITTFDNIKETIRLNDNLRGTFRQPGNVGQDIRGIIDSLSAEIGGALGQDVSAIEQRRTDANKFKKLTSVTLIDSLQKLVGTGAVSVPKFEALRDSLAGLGTDPDTNKAILISFMEEILKSLRIQGTDFPEIKEWESLLEELKRGGTVSGMSDEGLLAELKRRGLL